MRTEVTEKEVFRCPLCGGLADKIIGTGYWSCNGCNREFAIELRPLPTTNHPVVVRAKRGKCLRATIFDGDKYPVARIDIHGFGRPNTSFDLCETDVTIAPVDKDYNVVVEEWK